MNRFDYFVGQALNALIGQQSYIAATIEKKDISNDALFEMTAKLAKGYANALAKEVNIK